MSISMTLFYLNTIKLEMVLFKNSKYLQKNEINNGKRNQQHSLFLVTI